MWFILYFRVNACNWISPWTVFCLLTVNGNSEFVLLSVELNAHRSLHVLKFTMYDRPYNQMHCFNGLNMWFLCYKWIMNQIPVFYLGHRSSYHLQQQTHTFNVNNTVVGHLTRCKVQNRLKKIIKNNVICILSALIFLTIM